MQSGIWQFHWGWMLLSRQRPTVRSNFLAAGCIVTPSSGGEPFFGFRTLAGYCHALCKETVFVCGGNRNPDYCDMAEDIETIPPSGNKVFSYNNTWRTACVCGMIQSSCLVISLQPISSELRSMKAIMSEWDLNQKQKSTHAALEVGIASLGRRVAAYLINFLLSCLFGTLAIISIVLRLLEDTDTPQLNELAALSGYAEIKSLFAVSLIVFFIYVLVQTWMMSRYGQSIGKRIMNIRVIKTNGTDAGFVGTVLLREVLFNVVAGIISSILGVLVALVLNNTGSGEMVSNLVQSALWITCFIMACDPKRDRRTLQDMLADTVVVALPPKR